MKAFMSKRAKALLRTRAGTKKVVAQMLGRRPSDDLWRAVTDEQRNGDWHLVRGPNLFPLFAMCDQRLNNRIRVWHTDKGARIYDWEISQFLDLPSLHEKAPR